MPPYYSVYYSFPYSSFSQHFVKTIYETIFVYFPFQSGYWGSENNSLDEIMNWNTDLLNRRFELGYNDHYKNDYKQLLLHSEVHSHLRLFWNFSSEDGITLHMITPERDVQQDDGSWRLIGGHIKDFINLSVDLWETGLVLTVQTYHELDAPKSQADIESGNLPSTEPFCIIDRNTYMKLENELEKSYLTKSIKDGVLIIERIYASLINI